MSDLTITHNELLKALRQANGPHGREYLDALTTAEIQDATGRGEKFVRKQLRSLIRDGVLEAVTITVTDLAGRQNHAPAYRLKKAAA